MYTPIQVNIPSQQIEKIRKAVDKKKSASIQIVLNANGNNNKTLLLTPSQIKRLERAKLIGKPTINIRFSKKQLQSNMEHSGGFLGMLAGLAAKALPSLATGLATVLASGAAKKLIEGDGLFLQKKGHCIRIDPVKGKGLYLTPRKRMPKIGDGLFIRRGKSYHDGSGLIFGANSPFKNIPILNLLL